MEEVIVKFELKRKLNGVWNNFQGEIRLMPEVKTRFDAESIRLEAIRAMLEQFGQYPKDEVILTFEKP